MTFNNIPTSLILYLLIQALWIAAFFGVIQQVVVKAIRHERWHEFIAFYNPLVRNIAWILFAINIVYRLANVNPIVSLAVVGVVLALGWQSIRDFVQGTIFRLQKGNIKGQLLKVKSFKGVVNKMQNTKIELVTNNEEIIQIPYSRIITAITTKPTASKHLKVGHIFVDLPKDGDIEAIKSSTKERLLNMPWVVSSQGVKIEKKAGSQRLKVAFSTLDEACIERVKKTIN
jgi:hypothetical protein